MLRVASRGALGNTRSGGVAKKFRKARLDRGKIELQGRVIRKAAVDTTGSSGAKMDLQRWSKCR